MFVSKLQREWLTAGVAKGMKIIHWTSWEKLLRSKKGEGLEFKSLELVNEAILAKQLWRLIKELHLLMSRVLKKRYYYPHQELLKVKQKDNNTWLEA